MQNVQEELSTNNYLIDPDALHQESENPENNFQTETTILIPNTISNISSQSAILVKTLSFGVNGLLTVAYIVSSSKLLTLLNKEASGAGALISPFQSVILGGSVGFAFSTGLEIGSYIGKKEYRVAGDMIKTSWILMLALGVLSSAAMLSTRAIFPLIFEPQTAKVASDFFSGSAIGVIPMLMTVTNTQVVFQEGDWFIPPIAAGALFSVSATSSYFLAFHAELGAFGIGLGSSIGPLVVCLGMQAWLLRPAYKKYNFFVLESIPEWRDKLKKLFSSGWKISLQRLSEWGNLMLISTVMGIQNNPILQAINPAEQYISLLAAPLQGIAQAAGMLVAQNIGLQEKAWKELNPIEVAKWHRRNVHTLIQSNVAATVLCGGMGAAFCFARKPLSQFFLANDVDPAIEELAETLLWINMIGLLPDAVRIVSSGALRGWKDLLYPTLISLFIMTAVGVSAGLGAGKLFAGSKNEESESAWMFYIRNITMLVTAVIIVMRCRMQVLKDAEKIPAICPASNRSTFFQPVNTNGSKNDGFNSEEENLLSNSIVGITP